jgi:hypothetical protein
MKVKVFTDKRIQATANIFEAISRLGSFIVDQKPSDEYGIDLNTWLYIFGGRKSIEAELQRHPFIVSAPLGPFGISMATLRGTLGRSKPKSEPEIRFAKEVGSYGSKTCTLLVLHVGAGAGNFPQEIRGARWVTDSASIIATMWRQDREQLGQQLGAPRSDSGDRFQTQNFLKWHKHTEPTGSPGWNQARPGGLFNTR